MILLFKLVDPRQLLDFVRFIHEQLYVRIFGKNAEWFSWIILGIFVYWIFYIIIYFTSKK
uniref:Uncharacterized protein n=1 Tax=Gloeothece verrucosa (strain PCC 7822) TaxID=497965 RepID=E0UGA2_GLOV7|nr:hypothetical protein Cyan7822_4829 [Gloeothece verrucosa PCC 7822]